MCSIDGCASPAFARGWCKTHYGRWYRSQNPLCSVDDCKNRAWSRGWCSAHYKRWYEHGDPLYVTPPKPPKPPKPQRKPPLSKEERARRRREYQREYRQRPDVQARRRESNREYRTRPEVQARRREYIRAWSARPENADRIREHRREYDRKRELTPEQWVESRTRRAGEPALMSGGAELRDLKSMSPKDMTMLELSQFNESRIAVMLGVPPFLAGLPSGGDSLTYSNVSSLFDFHDRASLRPKALAVMSALSNWALPRGQSVELNRDEYSRPAFKERTDAYKTMVEIGAMTIPEVREMERLHGEISAAGLSGNQPPQQQITPTASPAPAPSPTGGATNG